MAKSTKPAAKKPAPKKGAAKPAPKAEAGKIAKTQIIDMVADKTTLNKKQAGDAVEVGVGAEDLAEAGLQRRGSVHRVPASHGTVLHEIEGAVQHLRVEGVKGAHVT